MQKADLHKKYGNDFRDFRALKVLLASPEDIVRWSRGEVTKPETINYRTGRPEADGLMCEKIFGPSQNYQCYCGKYRKPRYQGIVCDKCGVEVTLSKVRRERMGHIVLSVPVVHIWFFHNIPSKISIILDIPQKNLRDVVYYTKYIVVSLDEGRRDEAKELVNKYSQAKESELKEEQKLRLDDLAEDMKSQIKELKKQKLGKEETILQEGVLKAKFEKLSGEVRKDIHEEMGIIQKDIEKLEKLVKDMAVKSTLTDDEHSMLTEAGVDFYVAMIGALAIDYLLKNIDLKAEKELLEKAIVMSAGRYKMDQIRRLKYIDSLIKNNISPDWMVMKVVPVIPPDLRPIISLPGGRFAVSDLNDLYRRVINRNNRLKRLIEINAPEVILRNEKRMLQESVDSLIDNAHTPHRPVMNSKRLPYKSLTDQLRGKKGRFRRNLLGKRVDYSGRAVIIGDPTLKLSECGLPRQMALELFRPFVLRGLIERNHAINIQEAKELISTNSEYVWDVLNDVLKKMPVLLNRPPTLHKQNLQGFYAKLVEGDAIRINPLICTGYNADFDGDQMAVFVPLSDPSREEVKAKMFPKHNVLKLSTGESVISLSKDMVWGVYYLTKMEEEGTPRIFVDSVTAIGAYESGIIDLHAPIYVPVKDIPTKTTAGRLIFNNVLPAGSDFINDQMNGKKLNKLISEFTDAISQDELVEVLDGLKTVAFRYATKSGFSISKDDLVSFSGRHKAVEIADKKEIEIMKQYDEGLITKEEKEDLVQKLWLDTTEEVAQQAWQELQTKPTNSVFLQVETKASGSIDQMKQILGVKGLVKDPSGKWVNLPIRSNYTEGLEMFEFFIAAKGGRKGLADTALRTADSGYLTRKLVDVSHGSIIRMHDCGYNGEGVTVTNTSVRELGFLETIKGRVLAVDVVHPKTNKVIASRDEIINKKILKAIEEAGVEKVSLRSPVLCQAPFGMCAMCYGNDFGTNKLIEIGKSVGVIASQSIGELSTQMTLRTFHFGGSKVKDITQGVPKLVELFEARAPKFTAKISTVDGIAKVTVNKNSTDIILEGQRPAQIDYFIEGVQKICVEDGQKVKAKEELFIIDEKHKVIAVRDGKIAITGGVLTLSGVETIATKFRAPGAVEVLVKSGDNIHRGQRLTDGSVSPKELFETSGLLVAQLFILEQLQAVYHDQGIELNDKHLEVIIREMGRNATVIHPGDSDYIIGSTGNKYLIDLKNKILLDKGKRPIVYKQIFTGITASSLRAEGVLSALSFQEQVKVLTDVALRGQIDYLKGHKENVIIGRLIPSGEEAQVNDPEKMDEVGSI